MYCRKCGNELKNEKKYCEKCGFEEGTGEGYCSYCGNAVDLGQYICVNCGNVIKRKTEEEKSQSQKEKLKKSIGYLKYKENVKKTKIISLIMQVISLILVISLIFLPIYKCEIDIENIENFDQLIDAFENDGIIEKNFSLFDDLKIIFKQLTSEDVGIELFLYVVYFGLFAIFEALFAVILLITLIVKIFQTIIDMLNIEELTMLEYNVMKKTGGTNKKENIFKKQTIVTMILYAIFDIFETKFLGKFLGDLIDVDYSMRYMLNINGISDLCYIVITLIGVYLILDIVNKTLTKKMVVLVTKEQYL